MLCSRPAHVLASHSTVCSEIVPKFAVWCKRRTDWLTTRQKLRMVHKQMQYESRHAKCNNVDMCTPNPVSNQGDGPSKPSTQHNNINHSQSRSSEGAAIPAKVGPLHINKLRAKGDDRAAWCLSSKQGIHKPTRQVGDISKP
jgi:hypothetical protein